MLQQNLGANYTMDGLKKKQKTQLRDTFEQQKQVLSSNFSNILTLNDYDNKAFKFIQKFLGCFAFKHG